MKYVLLASVLLLVATPVTSRGLPAAETTVDGVDRAYFKAAARSAWRYGARYYRPTSGMVAAVPFYEYATAWDLGSSLAVLYSARELGFLPEPPYKARMRVALATLARLKLFENAGFQQGVPGADRRDGRSP